MPMYEYQCGKGHFFMTFLTVANHSPIMPCACGEVAQQIITAPLMVSVQEDICYDSPVTGEIISSWAQRRNDLAKHGCRPYDPAMKDDHLRAQQEKQDVLDKSIDVSVERSIEKMSTTDRGKLWSEVTREHKDLDVIRS